MPEFNYQQINADLVERFSFFLNIKPDFIDRFIIKELTEECGLSETEAFSAVLASAIGLVPEENDLDYRIYREYFPDIVKNLDVNVYRSNPYYSNIRFPIADEGKWSFRRMYYKPYEAFVCGDFLSFPDGRILPQIGFFNELFEYPAVLENDREWMTVTPNEIETMKKPIQESNGRVLAYGLGLGYFPYMVSEKKEVDRVVVVERDEDVIRLFSEHLLPQFPNAGKIEIVHADAFDYAKKEMPGQKFDTVFCDLWHDPSDGIPLYLRMKKYELNCGAKKFFYWIEDTLRHYLPPDFNI